MKTPPLLIFAFFAAALARLTAADAPDLKPLLAQPDKIVLHDDFSKARPVNKQQWGARQGTRWTIVDGVLRGQPSSAEYQAKKKDHKGVEPRISAPVTPAQFVAKFSVRFNGGSETAVVPFIEFGHHVCRVRLSREGTEVVADGDTTRLAEAKDFKYEPGKWYHVLAEMKGDEFVIQFAGGPTLYAKHECFTKPAASGANGLGIAGPKDGTAELDNVTLWTIKPEAQPGWASRRAQFPAFKPVEVKAKK
ncbi:MAG: hypothetical protein HY301_05950 [Verrucomicrobia bacterium]|nr:hypothetical protein [Verrucomicrobiota bacterium]